MATQTSTVTLSELKSRVLERADMVNSSFIDDTSGDSELVRYIQQSYRKLYNLVITSFSDWFVEDPVEFEITSGNTYTLDTDFYKLVGVDFYLSNSRWVEVRSFNFNERNRLGLTPNMPGFHKVIRYRLMGNKLRFIPSDSCTGTYRYWYVAKPSVPVSDADTIEGYNGWDEYVVIDAAIKCKDKEESDVRLLVAERAKLEEEILINARSRDESGTDRVTDVNADLDDWSV